MLIEISVNQYGTAVSEHICNTCGRPFTLTPSQAGKEGWDNCLDITCDSYDESRDADLLFEQGKVYRDDDFMTYPAEEGEKT